MAGDSVGGNMTAAVTLLAKERKTPEICYQALFYPVTDAIFRYAVMDPPRHRSFIPYRAVP